MRYYIDTEFIESPCTIDLISIGIVCENGREFYSVNADCDFTKADDWVKENVISKLPPDDREDNVMSLWGRREFLGARILNYIGDDKPEFWGYYADYDWVVFCWLFGKMIDLPDGWPMYCRDIKQVADQTGTRLPKLHSDLEHNALTDAWWNRGALEFLTGKWSKDVDKKTFGTFPCLSSKKAITG